MAEGYIVPGLRASLYISGSGLRANTKWLPLHQLILETSDRTLSIE